MDSEHNEKLHAQSQRTLCFLLESVAVLSHLSLSFFFSSFQLMINDWEASILIGSGKLRGRYYISLGVTKSDVAVTSSYYCT